MRELAALIHTEKWCFCGGSAARLRFTMEDMEKDEVVERRTAEVGEVASKRENQC